MSQTTRSPVRELSPLALHTIRTTPAVLRALAGGLPADVAERVPPLEANAGSWFPRKVVAHLIECHHRQVDRVRRTVEEDRPSVPPVDEEAALEATGLLDLSLEELLDTFARERAQDVQDYATLSGKMLGREYIHEVGGSMTIAETLNHVAYHDLQHIGQLARLLEVAADDHRGRIAAVSP